MSLVANLPLVTKVYFPRVLLPLASVLVPSSTSRSGSSCSCRSCGTSTRGRAAPKRSPLRCSLRSRSSRRSATGLFLSAVNVRYRDVPYLLPPLIAILPLVSRVPYSLNKIPEKWQWLLSANPMTGVITGWRWALIDAPTPNWGQMALSVVVALAIFVVGLAIFRSSEPRFADTI